MKSGIIILICFIAGVGMAFYKLVPDFLLANDYSIYILPVMMFFVGMIIGSDLRSLTKPLRMYKIKLLLIPLGTIAGTLIACLLLSFFFTGIPTRETVAIGSGFGYYSFSAIFLKELAGAEIGMMALVSNLFREIFTILAAPLLVLWFGKLAPIASAGATSADTSLPVISRYAGEKYIFISIFHGILVDLSVPVIISLLYM